MLRLKPTLMNLYDCRMSCQYTRRSFPGFQGLPRTTSASGASYTRIVAAAAGTAQESCFELTHTNPDTAAILMQKVFGTFAQLNARNCCSTCSSIVSAFVAHGVSMLNDHVFYLYISQLVQNVEGVFEHEWHKISYGQIRSNTDITYDVYGLDEGQESHQVLQLGPILGGPKREKGCVRLYNPLEIDIELVRKWIHECDAHSTCGSLALSNHLSLPSSLLLIDIKNGMTCRSPWMGQICCSKLCLGL